MRTVPWPVMAEISPIKSEYFFDVVQFRENNQGSIRKIHGIIGIFFDKLLQPMAA